MTIQCERCNETLDESKAVWLELDQDSGLYCSEGTIPEGHESQGCFPFGRACAASVVKAGGKIHAPTR